MRVGTLIKRRWNGYIGIITHQYSDRWLIHFINMEGCRWCSECELEVLCE